MSHYRKHAAFALMVQLVSFLGKERLQIKDYTPNPQVNWEKILGVLTECESKTKNIYQHQNIFSLQVYNYFYRYLLTILIAEKYLELKDAKAFNKHSAERRLLLDKHFSSLLEWFTPYQKNVAELKEFVLPQPLVESQIVKSYEADTATKLYKNYVQTINKTSFYKLHADIPAYNQWVDVLSALERAEIVMLHNLYDKSLNADGCYRYLAALAGAEKYLGSTKKDKLQRRAQVHEHLTCVIETVKLIQAKEPSLISLTIPSSRTVRETVSSSVPKERQELYRDEKLTSVLKKIEDYANFLKRDPRNHSFFGTSLRVSNKGQMLLDFVTDIQNATDLSAIKKIIHDFDLQQNKYLHYKAIFSLGQNATTLYFNSFMSNIGCATRLRTTTITLIDELRALINDLKDISLSSPHRASSNIM
ncbi:hypothetical protein [Legionella rowbothamii]|uniref:hypothetical protein n=1 Tax=Legionella rowbothamii TaxID=96229 RepID=UPI001056415D|nr:hypothetical protein [Legionella rowbothamii]